MVRNTLFPSAFSLNEVQPETRTGMACGGTWQVDADPNDYHGHDDHSGADRVGGDVRGVWEGGIGNSKGRCAQHSSACLWDAPRVVFVEALQTGACRTLHLELQESRDVRAARPDGAASSLHSDDLRNRTLRRRSSKFVLDRCDHKHRSGRHGNCSVGWVHMSPGSAASVDVSRRARLSALV
eukprot:1460426-Rhodomonas_salina.1